MKSFALALLLSPLPLVAQQPQLALQTVATGLNQPVDLVHAGDSRLFIVLQPGQIVIYDGTRILPTPFLDIDLAEKGVCVVTRIEERRDAPGLVDQATWYRGKIYLFAGPEQKQKFLADPKRYAVDVDK